MANKEIILSGVHMDLTEALKSTAREKLEKLFRHEDRIIRIRVELGYNHHKARQGEFMAKGQVEINGPFLIVTEATDDLYKSIDLMVQKLDRKLRRRARMLKTKRRNHAKNLDIPARLPKANVA